MTEQPPPNPPAASGDAPVDPARRRVLGGIALAGAALAVGGCQAGTRHRNAKAIGAADSALDAALRGQIRHVVVIYAENRSFNNLFGAFPGLAQPLSTLQPEQFRQRDRDGKVLATLPPIWHGLVPHPQVLNGRAYHIGEDAIRDLANAPFALHTPAGEPLPQALVTRDLIHSFYTNQLQINGGKNDGFVAWGDSGALVMGHYATGADNFALWRLAQQFTLCDNFFMGAFGGSFLNHQYLIAAQPPYFPHADQTPARSQITELDGGDPTGIHPKLADDSPASAMQGRPKFASRMVLTPDFWAVNTMGPPYAPAFTKDPMNPLLADPADPGTLPPQVHASIGDRLSAANVDWAWYAGGWQLALDGKGARGTHDRFPYGPNFQVHHQPFNYFRAFAPGTRMRAQHLRDAGVGSSAATNRFIADIAAGTLPAVAFYKPQGDLNLHAGYSDIAAGDAHLAAVIDALQRSPLWPHTLVLVTVDENGGWWDHVAPPQGDRWGPGTRVPTLVISPHAKQGHVEHTLYDTGSIQRLLNRRFGLEPLPGIVLRDRAMLAAGGKAPGDLTETLQFG